MKDFKTNISVIQKTVVEQKVSTETNLKEFCTQIMESAKNEMKYTIEELERNVNNTKIENGKYHVEAMRTVKEAKEKLEEFKEDKEYIMSMIEKQNTIYSDNKAEFDNMEEQFITSEKAHKNIFDSIKVSLILINLMSIC